MDKGTESSNDYPKEIHVDSSITEIHLSESVFLLKLKKEAGSSNFHFSRGGTGDLWFDKASGGFSSYCVYRKYKNYTRFKNIIDALSTDEYLILAPKNDLIIID